MKFMTKHLAAGVCSLFLATASKAASDDICKDAKFPCVVVKFYVHGLYIGVLHFTNAFTGKEDTLKRTAAAPTASAPVKKGTEVYVNILTSDKKIPIFSGNIRSSTIKIDENQSIDCGGFINRADLSSKCDIHPL